MLLRNTGIVMVEANGGAIVGATPIDPETSKILRLIEDHPTWGNKDLYRVYTAVGGILPWKLFRTTVGIIRQTETRSVPEIIADFEQERHSGSRNTRPRGGEMATIRREQLEVDQTVWVRVRIGGGVMKLKQARVRDVMRAAVNVQIEGEDHPRVVRYNELELTPDGSDKAPTPPKAPLTAVPAAFEALGRRQKEEPAPPVEPPRRRIVEPRGAAPLAPIAAPAAAAPAPMAPSMSLPPSQDAVGAWLAQGSALSDSLHEQQQRLQMELDELAAQQLRIEEATASKTAELRKVTTLLDMLNQMRSVTAA